MFILVLNRLLEMKLKFIKGYRVEFGFVYFYCDSCYWLEVLLVYWCMFMGNFIEEKWYVFRLCILEFKIFKLFIFYVYWYFCDENCVLFKVFLVNVINFEI